MSEKLKIKDLISVGIFSAVYLVIFLLVTSLSGALPILYFFSPAINALLLAPIFMLFATRVAKKFAVLIMGIVVAGIVTIMMPPFWPVYVFPVVCVLLAEFFAQKSGFKNYKMLTLSYVVFANWTMGVFSAYWIMKEQFFSYITKLNYPDAYVEGLEALIQPHILALMFVATIIAAIVGAQIAKKILKKHFKKAGVID